MDNFLFRPERHANKKKTSWKKSMAAIYEHCDNTKVVVSLRGADAIHHTSDVSICNDWIKMLQGMTNDVQHSGQNECEEAAHEEVASAARNPSEAKGAAPASPSGENEAVARSTTRLEADSHAPNGTGNIDNCDIDAFSSDSEVEVRYGIHRYIYVYINATCTCGCLLFAAIVIWKVLLVLMRKREPQLL